MLIENEERSHTGVRHILHGTLVEVVTRMREILARYPYAGYLSAIKELDPAPLAESPKRWRCVVSRLASCD